MKHIQRSGTYREYTRNGLKQLGIRKGILFQRYLLLLHIFSTTADASSLFLFLEERKIVKRVTLFTRGIK